MTTRHIVLGLDGSVGAAAAVRWCAEVGGALGAEIVAVNAMSPVHAILPSGAPAEIPPIIDDSAIEAGVHEELATELEEWCAPLRDAGVTPASRTAPTSSTAASSTRWYGWPTTSTPISSSSGANGAAASGRSCSGASRTT